MAPAFAKNLLTLAAGQRLAAGTMDATDPLSGGGATAPPPTDSLDLAPPGGDTVGLVIWIEPTMTENCYEKRR